MLRKNSIIKFVLLAIVAILGILLCVCPFAIPYSTSNFNGFVGAINKGVDLNGGVSALYECTLADGKSGDLSKAIDSSLSKLKTMFDNEGYNELFVTRQGENKINIVASGATEFDYAFGYIENGKGLSFTLNQYSDTLTSPDVYVTSSAVSKVRPSYDYESESYGIVLNFTAEGKKQIAALKTQAEQFNNDTIYVYLGEINTENTFAEIAYDDLNEDSIFLSASSTGEYSMDATNVTEMAYTVGAGTLDIQLTLKESSKVSAVFGKNTNLYLVITLAVIVVMAMAFMCIRYGHLGILASLSLAFYLVLYVFIIQSIPFVTLNIAGVVASVIAFAVAVLANAYVFEKIREEYAIGKKIHLSCKGGFKKALWGIIDSHAIMLLAGAFLWIFAPATLKVFGICIVVGAFLSAFSSLAMTRYFVNIYLPINSTKAKKLHLYRDKSVKEIKEEVEIIPEDVASTLTMGGENE